MEILTTMFATFVGFVTGVLFKNLKSMKMDEKITLTWTETESSDSARVGAMYCFHKCDINRN